jgi:Skp family chaperone for outer membrane proteins
MRFFTCVLFLIIAQMTVFAADLKIGVIDEQKLIDKYEKSVVLVKKLEDRYKKEEAKMKELDDKIKSAKRELMILDGEKREALLGQLRRYEVEFKVNREYLSEMLTVKKAQYTKEVRDDIQKAIELYSKDQKFDLILRKNLPGMRGEMPQKIVLYNKEKMDITNEILNMINRSFKEQNR